MINMLRFVILNIVFILCASFDLPPNFPKCNLNDPELNKCILNATEELRPQIRKGIEKLKIPAFDPLFASSFKALQETPHLNYTINYSNCTFKGLDTYKFKEIQYNPTTLTFNGNVTFNNIVSACFYDGKGNVLTFHAEGKGNVHLTMNTATAEFEVVGKLKKRDGVDYYNPTSAKIRGTIPQSSVHFDNLFDGNEELGQRTNELINQNSNVITKEVMPALEVLAEKSLIRMLKSFMKTVPYYELFST